MEELFTLFLGLNPCFDRIYFQLYDFDTLEVGIKVSILVLIEFIFNKMCMRYK